MKPSGIYDVLLETPSNKLVNAFGQWVATLNCRRIEIYWNNKSILFCSNIQGRALVIIIFKVRLLIYVCLNSLTLEYPL